MLHAAGLLRHATAVASVAAMLLSVLFAGTADGQEGYGGMSTSTSTSTSASELLPPLRLHLKHGAAAFPHPEVMPIPDQVTTDPTTQQPELLPLVTNPAQPEEQAAPATTTAAEGDQSGYGNAAPATTTAEGDQSGYGNAAPATPTAAEATPSESSSSWYSGPATGTGTGNTKVDADGEPTDGLSTKAIANILKEHNVFRSREHVPPLKWNATVAGYAQRYAEERKGDCALEHSAGGPYGENLMYGTGKAWTWKHTVDEWSDEKKSYHYRSNKCDAGKMCGHYTAVVWKDTTDVGCGRVTCASGDTLMVCSYWPPGNYVGEKPY